MNKKLKCIMLIDDSPSDNFFHEREIKKINPEYVIITKNTGSAALEYLKTMKENKSGDPDPIFLDINMPGMNGWEFLEEYNKLEKEIQEKAIIIMLTTSQNIEDKERAKAWSFVSDYITKPLTKEKMIDIIDKYFI